MENDDIFAKINFCYLVGYPHLKLASALPDSSLFSVLLDRMYYIECIHMYIVLESGSDKKLHLHHHEVLCTMPIISCGNISKRFCNHKKKIVTLPSKRFTNVAEYVIMHDFFSEQTLKLIFIRICTTLLSISD